jgi:hypothetical protein
MEKAEPLGKGVENNGFREQRAAAELIIKEQVQSGRLTREQARSFSLNRENLPKTQKWLEANAKKWDSLSMLGGGNDRETRERITAIKAMDPFEANKILGQIASVFKLRSNAIAIGVLSAEYAPVIDYNMAVAQTDKAIAVLRRLSLAKALEVGAITQEELAPFSSFRNPPEREAEILQERIVAKQQKDVFEKTVQEAIKSGDISAEQVAHFRTDMESFGTPYAQATILFNKKIAKLRQERSEEGEKKQADKDLESGLQNANP